MRLTFEQFCRINDLVNGATRLIDIEEIASDIEQDSGSIRVTINTQPPVDINSDGYVIQGVGA